MSNNVTYIVRLEYALQTRFALLDANDGCLVCWAYLAENRQRLIPKMVEAAENTQIEGDEIVARFVKGVHQRHLEGLSLS